MVAKGFTQKQCINYFDVYAPIARITTIRVLFALASIHKLIIYQIDIKMTFLNGDLEEEKDIDQPKDVIVHG